MNKNKLTIVLVIALLVSIAGYNLWLFAWKDFFYQCNALFLLLLFIVLKNIKVEERYFSKIVDIGLCCSVSNLIDEIFFDPTKYEWNEYVLILIIIYITFVPNNKKTQ